VALAATSSALTHAASKVGPTASEGHRLTLVLAVSAIGLAGTVWALAWLERRFEPSAAMAKAGHRTALGVVILLIVVAIVRFGSPIAIAGDMYDRFNAPPPGGFNGTSTHVGKNLNLRLFSLSGNARAGLWRIAWRDYRHHDLLGSGAGSYEAYYLQQRTSGLQVRNAHNLYLETLAEVGPIGLALLVCGLVAPLVAGIRGRSEPLVAAAFGAFAAYLLHVGADWDWQLTAVTLVALACAVGMLRSVPSARFTVDLGGRGVRAGILVAVAVLAVCALVGLRANAAASASQRAASEAHWSVAESQARTAVAWAPWSADARTQLGQALLGEHREADARTAFQAAIARDPGDWQAWVGLARASTGASRQAAIARARELDPREPQVLALH
jgi:O-antigen ligase/polysaccharide polymerase Wzy-like membrane protein